MPPNVELARLDVSRRTEGSKKAHLGQFLTPESTARFMARLFAPSEGGTCRLLDPGAGIGSLSLAFLERCRAGELRFANIDLTAFEIDVTLHGELREFLAESAKRLRLTYAVIGGDFVEEAVTRIRCDRPGFTHAILNPPYKKISSGSTHRLLIRQVGIETVNLYSAFLALTLSLMDAGGQVVAIVPRSFCNGPYYKAFRYFLLDRAAIRRMHLFTSRSKAFKDDQVLQENVIVLLERAGQQREVEISTSTDDTFDDIKSATYPFSRVVEPDDPELFIHFPSAPEESPLRRSATVCSSLADLGLRVSTGPVVDFRVQDELRFGSERETVPLLYPGHFTPNGVIWPGGEGKKPNSILRNAKTDKWLYPTGHYCVVRRFSSKEERRRVVAGVVKPQDLGHAKHIGFENHLNIIHDNKRGLVPEVAYGLAAFLNSTAVDEQFRQFNGHTQVNATDLKQLRYPHLAVLKGLGEWAIARGAPSQREIDEVVEGLI